MPSPNELKTCQTSYTNYDRHQLSIEHDITDNPDSRLTNGSKLFFN